MSTTLTETLVDPESRVAESSRSFEDETLSILTRIRGTLATAMEAFPGGVQKSYDIQKWLGVSFNVSWHIYRMMHAEHLLDISPHIPGPAPMKKLLAALAKKHVPKEAIVAVQEAYDAFQRHVQKSSGDRLGFDAMTMRMGGGTNDAQVEYTYRRSLFEGHRYVMGIEQDLFVASMILHPSASDPKRSDQMCLWFRKNLQRLRHDTEVIVDGTYVRKDAPPSGEVPSPFPLDAEAYKKYGFYILPDFCSPPDLVLEQELKPNGLFVTKWKADGVGRTNAIDVVSGTYTPAIELGRNAQGVYASQTWTNVVKPTRKLIRDIIIHRSAFGPVEFDLSRWGYIVELPGPHTSFSLKDVPRLPCSDKMSFMGGIDAGAIPELPSYLPLIREYCDRFGWKTEDLHLYRLRTDYPVLHVLYDATCLFPKFSATRD